MNQDQEYLRLLSIFHYVVGGLAAIFACFPCIHLSIGIALVTGAIPTKPGEQGFPMLLAWLFIVVALVLILCGWSFAIATICAGKFLGRRVHYLYCLVMAGVECVFMPFGTVLGVFTIIVLIRPSVKLLFPPGPPASPAPPAPSPDQAALDARGRGEQS